MLFVGAALQNLSMGLLSLLSLIPFVGAGLLCFIDDRRTGKLLGLTTSFFAFIFASLLWVSFDHSTSFFQKFESFQIVAEADPFRSALLDLQLTFGVDGISFLFIVLTAFLVPACLLVGWASIKHYEREFFVAFLFLEGFLVLVFSNLDLLFFYIFFESVLIPMFLIIGVWGARERKIRAAYQLFLYTLFGSIFMLLAILLIFFQAGSTDFQTLLQTSFSEERQILLWVAFFASFAVKVPMVPVHIWLPEAHVEAPTAGSVILAGILLKLGTYGFLRFSIPFFPDASSYFLGLVYVLSLVAILYASLTTLRQADMKKVIAYSSVAHMGYVTLGLFSNNLPGIEGSLLLMLSHGIVSSALFLCVGMVYERTHTRLLAYYGGSAQTMPLFSIFLFLFTLGNMSLPGTSSFIGEFLILAGVFSTNTSVGVVAASGMIFGTAYSIWLFNRIAFGNLKPLSLERFADLNRREVAILFPFAFTMIALGFYPAPFLEPMTASVPIYS
jgi:proton-translocating NADH-quinone oxidoreductase chain M